ncbi:MAG: hypothetical protein ACFFC7_20650 [Candidatus Hermodarchaeota archaeon]
MGFDPIKEKERRIAFVQTVNEEKARTNAEMEIKLASYEKRLKIEPKTSFSFKEISSLLTEIKEDIIKLNEQAYARLSVEGVKSLPFDTIIDRIDDLDTKVLVQGLQGMVKELEEQIRGNKFQKADPSLKAELEKQDARISALESDKDSLERELREKNSTIETLNQTAERLNREISQLRGKTSSSTRQSAELMAEIDTLKAEIGSKNTKITLLEQRQVGYTKKIEELREKNLDLERVKGELELKAVDVEPSIEEHKREINKLNYALNAEKNKTETLTKSNEELTERLRSSEEESNKYQSIADKLRRLLEEDIKYRMLFLLQDLQTATFEDLTKILAIKHAAVMALARTLEREDWIEVRGETITLKKALT